MELGAWFIRTDMDIQMCNLSFKEWCRLMHRDQRSSDISGFHTYLECRVTVVIRKCFFQLDE